MKTLSRGLKRRDSILQIKVKVDQQSCPIVRTKPVYVTVCVGYMCLQQVQT